MVLYQTSGGRLGGAHPPYLSLSLYTIETITTHTLCLQALLSHSQRELQSIFEKIEKKSKIEFLPSSPPFGFRWRFRTFPSDELASSPSRLFFRELGLRFLWAVFFSSSFGAGFSGDLIFLFQFQSKIEF